VVEENNLNQCITALRKSLGDTRHESRYIATIPSIGYRFVGEVKKVTDVVTARLEPADTTQIQPPAPTTTNRRPLLLLLVILVPALALLGFVLFNRNKQPAAPHVASIAVLPLDNLSGKADEEYFADGVTDALIGDLAKLGQLRVISRTSSMQYKRTKKSLPEIARELNVDAIVEGSVQREGERVRVRAQLIHGASDEHLWAETYERDVRNIMDLQSEIAQAIAREVQIKLSPADQARLSPRRAVHPKAFDDYLQGRYLFWNKRTEENLQKAIGYFESANKQDPEYALAYAGLADCYNAIGAVQFGTMPPMEARSRAQKAAEQALRLDSNLAEAHSALGFVNHYNWNWSVAEQELKRAIELNPSYAQARMGYASYLMSLGRVQESLAEANRATELDPLSLSISVQRGFLLENARNYTEAIEQMRRVIAVDPNHYQAHWMLGHTYVVNKQFEEAIASAEKAVELSQRAPGALGMLGMIYGLAERKDEATKILKELLTLNERRYVTPAALAYVYIGLGDKDQAFVWIEKAYQERSNFVTYLKVVPIVDSLRSDPRFSDLIRRVGLPQ
jgi:TolB-like protein/Flp pilus assembly protein TadD